MKIKLSRELGDLYAHRCFFISPLEYNNLMAEFEKYDNESDLPNELKNHLKIARKRRKESKNILSNGNENNFFIIRDIVDEILKERGIK